LRAGAAPLSGGSQWSWLPAAAIATAA